MFYLLVVVCQSNSLQVYFNQLYWLQCWNASPFSWLHLCLGPCLTAVYTLMFFSLPRAAAAAALDECTSPTSLWFPIKIHMQWFTLQDFVFSLNISYLCGMCQLYSGWIFQIQLGFKKQTREQSKYCQKTLIKSIFSPNSHSTSTVRSMRWTQQGHQHVSL